VKKKLQLLAESHRGGDEKRGNVLTSWVLKGSLFKTAGGI
jgi:hypothetical protein